MLPMSGGRLSSASPLVALRGGDGGEVPGKADSGPIWTWMLVLYRVDMRFTPFVLNDLRFHAPRAADASVVCTSRLVDEGYGM